MNFCVPAHRWMPCPLPVALSALPTSAAPLDTTDGDAEWASVSSPSLGSLPEPEAMVTELVGVGCLYPTSNDSPGDPCVHACTSVCLSLLAITLSRCVQLLVQAQDQPHSGRPPLLGTRCSALCLSRCASLWGMQCCSLNAIA